MPSELSMLDALRLAKETPGTKVRSKRWADCTAFVHWDSGDFVFEAISGNGESTIFSEDELLGPWEVVP
jgi:hypothetical protein